VAKFYRGRFCTISIVFFERGSQETKEVSVPDLDFNDFESMDNVFANNLTYSMDNFSNVFNVNRDYNTYTINIFCEVI
jgi:hypothetical protein